MGASFHLEPSSLESLTKLIFDNFTLILQEQYYEETIYFSDGF